MTKPGQIRRYQLFDRVLESPVEINLLREVTPDQESQEPTIFLRISKSPRMVEGDIAFGGAGWPVTYFSGPKKDYVDFRGTNQLAVIDKSGLVITLHPKIGEPNGPAEDAPRRIVDSLVTTILSRIPILWGSPPIHCATLLAPEGPVLLIGESGHGKSTLSQVLRRSHSWRVLDDDTAILRTDSNPPFLVPMGAASRLRKDAATNLEIGGTLLPGYSGGKVFVPNGRGEESERGRAIRLPIAMFKVVPANSLTTILIERVEPVMAAPELWTSVFTSDSSPRQVALRFRASSILAQCQMFLVHYTKGVHTPEAVSREIAKRTNRLVARTN